MNYVGSVGAHKDLLLTSFRIMLPIYTLFRDRMSCCSWLIIREIGLKYFSSLPASSHMLTETRTTFLLLFQCNLSYETVFGYQLLSGIEASVKGSQRISFYLAKPFSHLHSRQVIRITGFHWWRSRTISRQTVFPLLILFIVLVIFRDDRILVFLNF